jgi:hypothetical protein
MKITASHIQFFAAQAGETTTSRKSAAATGGDEKLVQFSAQAVSLEKSAGKENMSLDAATEARARQAMAGVDLRSIRYTDLVQVANDLRDVGALSEDDYLSFIGPSPEFATVNGERNPRWNEPRDLIGMRRQDIAFSESIGMEQRFIDQKKHMLSLYESFYALQPASI